MKRFDLAVIGGGSVASALLFHLVEAWQKRAEAGAQPRRFEVAVFEPAERLGRGGAYADDLDSNLLNVTAGAMSIAGDDRGHFFRWLDAEGIRTFRGEPIASATYLPRCWFGRYLEECIEAARAMGERHGLLITHCPVAAVDLQPEPDQRLRISGADGQDVVADRAVLAIGNLPATALTDWNDRPGYRASPYPTRSLVDSIDRDAAVGIVGTSLSAIDAIAALADAGHRGPIHAVSRQGRLPAVRGLRNGTVALSEEFRRELQQRLQARAQSGTRLSLAGLQQWLGTELRRAGIDPADVLAMAAPPLPAQAFVEREIELAETAARPWQSMGNALNEVIDQLWHLLDEPGRQQFEREIRPVWLARRVTFPLSNARLLLQRMRSGQLTMAGGLVGIDAGAGPLGQDGFALRFAAAPAVRVDVLINATSFSSDPLPGAMPLLDALQRRGLAVTDPYGGFALDFATGCVRRADGAVDPRLSVLGSLAAGTYFWTNAMDVNARLAMGQARRLVAALPRS